MLSNKDIYNLLDQLGLTDEDNRCCCADDLKSCIPADQEFAQRSSDIVYVTNFVTDIFVNNDRDTLEKFMVALLIKNSSDNNA